MVSESTKGDERWTWESSVVGMQMKVYAQESSRDVYFLKLRVKGGRGRARTDRLEIFDGHKLECAWYLWD